MNVYENITIFNPSLPDEDIEAATQKVKDIIVETGGEVLKVDPWGRRKLAYELNKQTRGFFTLFLFKAPPATVKRLEDFYKIFDPVFKYMVVRLEKKQMEATLKALEEKVPEPEAAATDDPAAEKPAEEAEEATNV